MKALVIGCGRTGAAVAKGLAAEGWDVTALDESEDALIRLGASWRGGFVLGHGLDGTVLARAGVDDADAAVVATDGDNTNVVIGQVLQRRYGIGCVVVLADADSLDDHDILASRVEDRCNVAGRARHAPELPACRHAADEHGAVGRMASHAHAVAKDRATCKWAGRIDSNHPDLTGAIVDQYDAVGKREKPHFHGTGMVGAIAAHQKLLGIAPNARILAVQAFSSTTRQSPEATTRQILALL